MDKLAIIGTGYMARIIGERAKKLGIETHCFSIDEHSKAAEVCDYFYYIDVLDVEALTDRCREIGINGVVATTELTIYPAAYVSNSLGLNGNSLQTAKEIIDKTIIREKTSNVYGLCSPRFWKCKDVKDIPKIDCFPVIVKPIAAGGEKRNFCCK